MKLQIKLLDLSLQLFDGKVARAKKQSNISDYSDYFLVQKEGRSVFIEQITPYWSEHKPFSLDLFHKQTVFIDVHEYIEEDSDEVIITSNAQVSIESLNVAHVELHALTCSASVLNSSLRTLSVIGENCSIKLVDVSVKSEADITYSSGSLIWKHCPGDMLLDVKTLSGSASYKGDYFITRDVLLWSART